MQRFRAARMIQGSVLSPLSGSIGSGSSILESSLHSSPASPTSAFIRGGLAGPASSRGFASSNSEFVDEPLSARNPLTNPRPLEDAEVPDVTQEVVHIAETEMIETALDGAWYNTEAVVRLVSFYHNDLALPWWAAVFATTLSVRLGLSFPIAAMSARKMQRTVDASVDLKPIYAEMKQFNPLTNPNAPKSVDRLIELRAEMKAIYKKHRADPTGPIKILATQGFISASIFLGLRKLVTAGLPSMTQEGLLWFDDLTVQDPYFILPALVGGCFYTMVRRNINPDAGDMSGLQESNPMMDANTIKSTQKFMALAFIPFMAFMPAGLNLYYLGSMGIGVVQAGLMRSAAFRRMLGLPPKPGMSSQAAAATVAVAAQK